MTVKTLASGLSDKLQPNDIIRIYHFLETAEEVVKGLGDMESSIKMIRTKSNNKIGF